MTKPADDVLRRTKLSRRSFLGTALAGGAAYVSLARDMSAFAQAGGPIVIGHHVELTGGFASWGYWHNKCALAGTKVINDGGGIAGQNLVLNVYAYQKAFAASEYGLGSAIGVVMLVILLAVTVLYLRALRVSGEPR